MDPFVTTTPIRRGLAGRKLLDRLVRVASVAALVIALGGMCWILWTVAARGASVLSWNFFTEPTRPHGVPNGGIGNAILGTLAITGGAAAIALPLAFGAGIYLAEFGRGTRFADAIRFAANVMLGIPSVLVGLFVYAVWVVTTGEFSGFAGSLALAVIMFPVVVRTTEEMLAMVPDSLRESALALGMTRSRATLCIICRAARNGLATGVLLAVARVSGETAPLLFTALWSNSFPTHYFSEPTANLPVVITEYTTNSPWEAQHAAGWGAALIVMLLVLLLNIGCRVIFQEKKHG